MRLKALIASALPLALAAMGYAQNSVSLTFTGEAKREIWIGSGPVNGPAKDSLRSESTLVTVPAGGHSDSENVYVWDQTSGNLASKPLGEVKKTATWDVKDAAYGLIATVTVRVEHLGQPLASGEITLSSGAQTVRRLLDPNAKGEAHFYAVKPGSLKVSVRYPTKDGAEKSITQLLEAPLKRSDATPTAVISIAEDVATVGAPASGASSAPGTAPAAGNDSSTPGAGAPKTPAAPKSEEPNAFGTFIVYLIGIGIAALVAFLGLKYAKQNPELVQGKLEQLGVDIPKPGEDVQGQAYDPVPAPMPKKPEPPQKIMLDDAALTPLTDAAPVAAVALGAVAVSPGEPSLIGGAGDLMVLPEGETVVGREVGLGLSLVEETTVSRRHAQILRSGPTVTVTDLGSTNGTFVNGSPLKGTATLRPGDTVQFGAVPFRFEA